MTTLLTIRMYIVHNKIGMYIVHNSLKTKSSVKAVLGRVEAVSTPFHFREKQFIIVLRTVRSGNSKQFDCCTSLTVR